MSNRTICQITPRGQGWIAFYRGIDRAANPHTGNDHDLWNAGWDDARLAQIDREDAR